MFTRHRIPVLIAGTAASVLLLAGCASSGTVGAKSSGGAAGGLSTTALATNAPATTDSTSAPSTDSSTTDSAIGGQLKQLAGMMTDPGCKEAVNALGDALALQNDPLKMAGALPQVITKMRQGASDTKKPAAKDAITKMADDLQNVFDTAKSGGTPDTSNLQADGETFGMACVG